MNFLKIQVEKNLKPIVAISANFRYKDYIHVKIQNNFVYIQKEDLDKIEDLLYFPTYPPRGEFELQDSEIYEKEIKEFKIIVE